jgi:hypothetical protein
MGKNVFFFAVLNFPLTRPRSSLLTSPPHTQATSEGCGEGARARGGVHCGGLENGKKKQVFSHYLKMGKNVFFFAVFKSPAIMPPLALTAPPHPSDAT